MSAWAQGEPYESNLIKRIKTGSAALKRGELRNLVFS
jgi:hypothetical protein